MNTLENNLEGMFQALSDEMKEMNCRLNELNADFFFEIIQDAMINVVEGKESEYESFFNEKFSEIKNKIDLIQASSVESTPGNKGNAGDSH